MAFRRTGAGFSAFLGLSLLTLSAATGTAMAETEPRYDRRIEEAAIRMLQPKLGSMRGTLDLDTSTHLFPPLSRRLILEEPDKQSSWPPPGHFERQDGSIIRY